MSEEQRGTEVEFDSLIGEHMLDAVDTSTERVKTWDGFEDANVLRFRLDGNVYTAVEDPSDGYRSSMNRFYVSDDPIKNTFPPCRVLVKKSENGDYGQVNDSLEMIDMQTGKVVLRVGTDNTDDYYPWFVSEWTPENLAINVGK